MTSSQILALCVLAAVIAALVWDRIRSDVVALTGAAILLATGVVRPSEVQGAFASPAIIALASLFVIAYAMELSGLLDAAIRSTKALCQRLGRTGLWLMIAICGSASAFLNNTPIVVLAAPVVRDVAESLGYSAKRFLIPLSYAAVLGGSCTLIGTSTNLLVNDMASVAGQPRFGLFEITPVGVAVAVAGGLYLLFFSKHLVGAADSSQGEDQRDSSILATPELVGAQVGTALAFSKDQPLHTVRATVSLLVFVGVVGVAAAGVAPIAAAAFAGAVLLILSGVISADEAYRGLRPDVLMLIAGMVVLGIALEKTGLAGAATEFMISTMDGFSPLIALIALYGATLLATEILSNATVAVLFTPIAVSFAEALNVSPRPFLVAVMLAGSAAFATPFGYQTNVIVYRMGGYSYMDFVRLGIPLNIITWIVAVIAIQMSFPF